ncbi:unnamed protein product [Tilletia controversa]|uniref:Putative 5'-nucleotidase C-terminal domain-containing protein n=3 Tax=Tilletia TaxID=13289 RepID=A0A8X7T155_9BASI|nr:hypothetical protein CF336_g673 [Tilletia laevis]KAE8206026.1 hypothetical protein CF328_g161 [Tilletia controversa]KAE8265623.1 hypothetical protein A4X03_0g153 [Tilletia caries]KAE8208413.1 hypothetical protein CF335_g432 [Tilletia laevis]KAE8255430.1 hypothetical protein A4X06_0g424 [Tilletia controversa]
MRELQGRRPQRSASPCFRPATATAAVTFLALLALGLIAASPQHYPVLIGHAHHIAKYMQDVALRIGGQHRKIAPCYLHHVGRRKECAWLAQHQPWLPRTDDAIRPLPWGELNFLHTTDGHGWLSGHHSSSPPEPQYSADLASWASFSSHMKQNARSKAIDLLVVDSGDLYDGNGLSDGYPNIPPGQPNHEQAVQGHVAGKLISLIDYDLLTIGNHELYNYSVAKDVHLNFAPRWNGRYLTSNTYIHLNQSTGNSSTSQKKPIGSLYARFQTPTKGFRITSFGVLFNFQGAGPGIEVQDPALMVKEPWFQKALDPAVPVDVFVVAAHMPVRGDSGLDVVHQAIRRVHNDTPIVFLGGHTHVRDCRMLDDRTLAIESGRYFETFGFASVSGIKKVGATGGEGVLRFARRYIDANALNLAFHAGVRSAKDLVTAQELFIRRLMQMISRAWGLDTLHGVVPGDYFLERFHYGHNQSLLSLLSDHVLPTIVRPSDPRAQNNNSATSSLILINSFSQRHDVLAGVFTTNEQYIVSPYRDRFKYVRDVPWAHANLLLERLNEQKSVSLKDSWRFEDRRYGWGFIDDIFDAWQGSQWALFSKQRRSATMGASKLPFHHASSAGSNKTAHQESEASADQATLPPISEGSAVAVEAEAGSEAHTTQTESSGASGTDTTTADASTDKTASGTMANAVLDAVQLANLPSLGYKTTDGCEGEGDDTEHTPITFSPDQPTYVASLPDPLPGPDAVVDVVFVEFIRDPILRILNELSGEGEGKRRYDASQVELWGNVTTQLLYPLYARARWQRSDPDAEITKLERVAQEAGFQRWPGEPFDAQAS